MTLSCCASTGSLIAIPFQGEILYGEVPGSLLRAEDLRMLEEYYASQLMVLRPYMQQHYSHVYVPLSTAEEGYHVAFSGRFALEEFYPFFRREPNALTVADGRPWGFFRIRLIHVNKGASSFERIAEVEVHASKDPTEVGFELFWAAPESSPTHLKLYDRRPQEGTAAIASLLSKWTSRLQLSQEARVPEYFASELN